MRTPSLTVTVLVVFLLPLPCYGQDIRPPREVVAKVVPAPADAGLPAQAPTPKLLERDRLRAALSKPVKNKELSLPMPP